MDRHHLTALLATHRTSDTRERGFVVRMQALLAARDPFDRSSFVPGHFTASAFVLSPDRARLLLIFHRKLERWLQPGGHVDPSDRDVLEAARRELFEEVGLRDLELLSPAILDVDIHSIPARRADPVHEHFDVRFAFGAATEAFVHNDEAADVRWVELAELEHVTRDLSVLRAAAKLQTL